MDLKELGERAVYWIYFAQHAGAIDICFNQR